MANCADCAIAIAKEDLHCVQHAIYKTEEAGDGIETCFTFEIEKGDEKHDVECYCKHIYGGVGNSTSVQYYKVDGEKLDEETYEKRYPRDEWSMNFSSHKCVLDKTYSNGWCVDWQELGTYSYEVDPNVQEYDDHLTIYFGGRWSFPEALEDYLDKKEVRWQGAEAECGCEILNDELGNDDFGLVATIEKDEEGYDNYYVEDRS